MKTRFIILYVCFLCLFATHMVGQERINRLKIGFTQSSSPILKATGWSYNDNRGEWIDYENVISPMIEYKGKFVSQQGEFMMSRTPMNFIAMQFKTLVHKKKTYYVLLVEKWTGQHQSPIGKKDWKSWKEINGYVFTEKEFKKLKKIKKEVRLYTFTTVNSGREFDENNFLDTIQLELDKKKEKKDNVFRIKQAKEGMVRFLLPYKPSEPINFEKNYFEMGLDDYYNLTTLR